MDQLGNERIYSVLQLPGHNPSLRKVRVENCRQKLKQRSQRRDAYWLLPKLAFSYLPRGGAAHRGYHLLTSTNNQETVMQLFPQAILREAVLQLRLPLPRYQVVKWHYDIHSTFLP